jgi:DNA-binding MarR family transcriptional regulator
MLAVERIDTVHGTNGSSRTNGLGGRRRGRNGEAIGLSVNFGPLAHWVGFNLRMAQEAAFQAFSHLSQEIGESPGRFATLTLIARNPGISQTELSLANGRDKSSLTPVVEDLVKRGLVERKRMDSDRRTYRLNLTPSGKRVLTMLTRCARRHERNLDRVIGERDRKRFIQILKKIAAELGEVSPGIIPGTYPARRLGQGAT